MNRTRVLVGFGLTALLGTAVWWMLHHENAPTTRPHSENLTAASPSRSILPADNSVTIGSSHPNSSPMNTMRTGRPTRVIPAESTTLPPKAMPAGLERMRLVLNSTSGVSVADRVHALRALPTKLTVTEMDALSRYLRSHASNAQNAEEENWLRNEMLDLLVQQADTPADMAGLLIAVYQDPAQDPVMRDYSVQHMAAIFGRASREEQANLGNILWLATTEVDSSIAGTALLALATISETDAIVDKGSLADRAVKLAADDQTGELARITAIQVCGRLGARQALPVIERLMQQPFSVPLRVAATAALGDYAVNGTSPEITEAENLLAHVARSSDPRQALAAESALRRIARIRTSLAEQTGS